jgi:hypothetical protein
MWSSSGWTALRRGGRWLELDGDEEGSKRGNDVAALGGGGLSAEHDASWLVVVKGGGEAPVGDRKGG